MNVIEWSPDGSLLAVGHDDGQVSLYDVEKAQQAEEQVTPLFVSEQSTSEDPNPQHQSILCMQWMQCDAALSKCVNQQRFSAVHSLRDRASRFFPVELEEDHAAPIATKSSHGMNKSLSLSQPTVLVTADACGRVVFWFYGRVRMAELIIPSCHLDDVEGNRKETRSGLKIETLFLVADLSCLFLALRSTSCGRSAPEAVRIDIMDLGKLFQYRRQLFAMAAVKHDVWALLRRISRSNQQLAKEWKNAIRIFELKMGLMGSLYEKYASETPPQVDLLCLLVSGNCSPALAQYFAQDLPEMSVRRMQQALAAGSQTLLELIETQIKPALGHLLFLLAELLGLVTWDAAFTSLGLNSNNLKSMIQDLKQMLFSMNTLKRAVEETQQNFTILFDWFLSHIQFHTGAAKSMGNLAPNHRNYRRLCLFLERAAEYACEKSSRDAPFKVEVTFGNSVSQWMKDMHGSMQVTPSFEKLLDKMKREWEWWTGKQIHQGVGETMQPKCSFPVTSVSQVEEIRLLFDTRSEHLYPAEEGEDSDGAQHEEEALDLDCEDDDNQDGFDVNFDVLQELMDRQHNSKEERVPSLMVAIRGCSTHGLTSCLYVVKISLCSLREQGFSQCDDLKARHGCLVFPSDWKFMGFDIYSVAGCSLMNAITSDKPDQLALLVEAPATNEMKLCLQQPLQRIRLSSPFKISGPNYRTIKQPELPTYSFRIHDPRIQQRVRALVCRQPPEFVIAHASRGIVCVGSKAFLTVFDIEDDDEEVEVEDDSECHDLETEDSV